jgi:hypothetical protein
MLNLLLFVVYQEEKNYHSTMTQINFSLREKKKYERFKIKYWRNYKKEKNCRHNKLELWNVSWSL